MKREEDEVDEVDEDEDENAVALCYLLANIEVQSEKQRTIFLFRYFRI